MPIRPYCPDDAAAIAQLFYDSVRVLGLRRYNPEQVVAWAPAVADPARWQAQFSDGRTVLVSVDAADRVLAFASLERDGHLDHLYRPPDATRPGLAADLLDAIIADAEGQGIGRLHTEVSALARGLFERRGFGVIARREFEVRGVAIWNWAMERLTGNDAGA